MTAYREFVIGKVEGLMRLALFLVLGILSPPRKEVRIGPPQIVKGPLHHTFGHLIRPGIGFCSNGMKLLFEGERVGRGKLALSLRHRFLFCFIGLILLFPLLPSPVVDEASGTAATFEILHLFRRRVHPNFVCGFHL